MAVNTKSLENLDKGRFKKNTREKQQKIASMGGKIGQFNEETIAKMSASKIGAKNSFFGKHHTDETRKTISEWHKNNGGKLGNHNMAKKVRCIETGVVYSCVLEASKETGANSKHIGGVANGRYGRKTAGGFTWEWA